MRAKRAENFHYIKFPWQNLHRGSASRHFQVHFSNKPICQSITEPVFYLRICKQLSTFAVNILLELLPEDIDNNNNTV
ncbi:hypothetical protein HOLleu_44327 [Holothuria leucospilota]|uniref:Uncharacterized protein n=1 Tax=Holothuria leucospilota TaxID=206669 RepID=A0A9Q0Y9Q7_HOLLE|nr:hypothetical protein HOLleu_44327 [Holothuria leucospilota]